MDRGNGVPHRLHPLLHPPGGSNSYAIAFGTAVGDRTRQLGVIGLNCTSRSNRLLWLRIVFIKNSFFQLDFPASMLQENSVKIIVYDIELEQISLWKE
jgi:hypothetical protein